MTPIQHRIRRLVAPLLVALVGSVAAADDSGAQAAGATATPAQPPSRNTNAVLLRGGWLFDAVRNDVRRNSGIVMMSGKLMEVDANLAGRDLSAYTIVDLGDDDHVVPGIFDSHPHYNVNLFGRNRRDETTVQPVVFLANGLTSTFPAGEYNPDDMAALHARIESGQQPEPRVIRSGAYFGRRDVSRAATS